MGGHTRYEYEAETPSLRPYSKAQYNAHEDTKLYILTTVKPRFTADVKGKETTAVNRGLK